MSIDTIGSVPESQYLLITGSPVDGFLHTGPFPNYDTACDYAERFSFGDWWVTPVLHPAEVEGTTNTTGAQP